MKRYFPYTLNLGGQLLELKEPLVMGILNATPDSFYAESRTQSDDEIARRVDQLLVEGAAIIDVGGCSTRPSSEPASEEEEKSRLRSALSIIRKRVPNAIISVDTFRASIARYCVEEFGVSIINDVTGGSDPEMFATASKLGVPYVLTCPTASPFTPAFAEKLSQLREMGQKDIILDPGFGFGKTLDENYQLMGQLEAMHTFGLPLLVGISRKSMIYKLLGTSPQEALNGTTVLNTLALLKGASMLRVHDVRAAMEAIRIVEKLKVNCKL